MPRRLSVFLLPLVCLIGGLAVVSCNDDQNRTAVPMGPVGSASSGSTVAVVWASYGSSG
ncbi:MAG: hypothetical protein KKA42_06225 [candidate division Zixibacteria bacterium]|nr:hypothetical protein [candidate division Zixibacteria bacterium]